MPPQSTPFSSFHLFKYPSPLSAPFASPSNRPFVGLIFFVTNGVSCDSDYVSPCEARRSISKYLAVFQLLRHDVCPDLSPFNYVAPMLRMPTHCPCARAFVEAITDLLSRKW